MMDHLALPVLLNYFIQLDTPNNKIDYTKICATFVTKHAKCSFRIMQRAKGVA